MLETEAPNTEEAAPSETEMWELVAKTARRRSATYALLARIFRVEVDAEFLKSLKGMRFPAKTGNDLMDKGYRAIGAYLGKMNAGTELELRIDYVRAFIGEGTDGKSAAYPFESVYTSERHLRMQDARDEVLAVYRSEGLDKDSTWHDDEDHVALELEFMQFLCDKLANAVDAGDYELAQATLATQSGFLSAHLCNWVPLMTADVRKCAKTSFYKGLAALTEGFLQVEEEMFEELLDDQEEDDE